MTEVYEDNSFGLCFYHSCMEKSSCFGYERSYNKKTMKETKQN